MLPTSESSSAQITVTKARPDPSVVLQMRKYPGYRTNGSRLREISARTSLYDRPLQVLDGKRLGKDYSSARVIRVATALPDLQPDLKIVSAGMTQGWTRRQALRKVNAFAGRSSLALKVESFSAPAKSSGRVGEEIKPQRPRTAPRSVTASSPALWSGGGRANTP